jgi:ABC-type lipoprotein release transport system permease subunit
MLTFKLAWRSFVRHRWRSALTCSAVALGMGLLLGFDGLTTWGHANRIERAVRMGSGHVVVQPKGLSHHGNLHRTLDANHEGVVAAGTLTGVEHMVQRLEGHGLLSTGVRTAAVSVAGVESTTEPIASTIASKKKRLEGHYLRPRSELAHPNQPGDVYIGAKLAARMNLSIDDRLVLTVTGKKSKDTRSAAFYVRGIYQTRIKAIDGFRVEIDLAEAQQLFDAPDQITQLAFILDDARRVPGAKAALSALAKEKGLAEWDVQDWQEAIPILKEAAAFEKAILGFLLGIVFIVVAIGIFNTLLMSVVERTRQFGVMMAVGTSSLRLFATILCEALVLAVISIAIGSAVGYLIHSVIASIGIDATIFYGKDVEVAGMIPEGRVYSKLPLSHILRWGAAIMVVVVAAAAYPAYRVTKLRPVDAIDHV